MSNRILLVEDDQSFGAVLKDYLSINNFEVTLATDGEMGLKEFTEKELMEGYKRLERLRNPSFFYKIFLFFKKIFEKIINFFARKK